MMRGEVDGAWSYLSGIICPVLRTFGEEKHIFEPFHAIANHTDKNDQS